MCVCVVLLVECDIESERGFLGGLDGWEFVAHFPVVCLVKGLF